LIYAYTRQCRNTNNLELCKEWSTNEADLQRTFCDSKSFSNAVVFRLLTGDVYCKFREEEWKKVEVKFYDTWGKQMGVSLFFKLSFLGVRWKMKKERKKKERKKERKKNI
jgi:hypothetical protein